jgi:hypothetical protein
MTASLAHPSFWSDPRDPWAWQRALRCLASLKEIPGPWPAWEGPLRGLLPRRSVAGLYGFRKTPRPGVVLGVGFLIPGDGGWQLARETRPLIDGDRAEFEHGLALWLVQRSPWVRHTLRQLASGAWRLPSGTKPLQSGRTMRIGEDLITGSQGVRASLDAVASGAGRALRLDLPARELALLRAPLYLLHAIGWLDASGRPSLPPSVKRELLPASPAEVLRQISAEVEDRGGFVAVEPTARRLCAALYGKATGDLAGWVDTVFGDAINSGRIEVHEWAPGQPRHGRGLFGDRDRKLVRWTVHDDFVPSGGPR